MEPHGNPTPAGEALFAYGTLMFGEVMAAVAGAAGHCVEAELAGFARRRLRGVVYPGIVPRAGGCVTGRLWTGLARETLVRLDRFEGPMYRRESVRVRAGGREQAALAYVVAPGWRWMMTDRDWCPEAFRARSLGRYVTRVGHG